MVASPASAIRIRTREDIQLGAVLDKVLEVHLQRHFLTKTVFYPFPTFEITANLSALLLREGCPYAVITEGVSDDGGSRCSFARQIGTALSGNARFEVALTQLIANLTRFTEHLTVPDTEGIEIQRDSRVHDPSEEQVIGPAGPIRASVAPRVRRQSPSSITELMRRILSRSEPRLQVIPGKDVVSPARDIAAPACDRAQETAPPEPAHRRPKRLAVGLGRLFGLAPVEQVDELSRQEWNTEKHVAELYQVQTKQVELVQQIVHEFSNETESLEEEIRLILNATVTGVSNEIDNQTANLAAQILHNHVLQQIRDHQLGSYERVLAVRQLIMQAMYHQIPTALASITTDAELLEALDYAQVWVQVNHTGATIWVKTSKPIGKPTEIFLITTIPTKLPGASHYMELKLQQTYVARLPENISVALTPEAYTLCVQHRPLCGGSWFITGPPSSCAEALFERNLLAMNHLCKTEIRDFQGLPFVKTLMGGRIFAGNIDRYTLSCKVNNSYHTTERLVAADIIFQVPCKCQLHVAGHVFISDHICQPKLWIWEVSSLLPYASYLSETINLTTLQHHIRHNTSELYESRPLIKVSTEALKQFDSAEIRLNQLNQIMVPDPFMDSEFQLPSIRYVHQYLGVIFQILAVLGSAFGMLSLICICKVRRRLQILNLCLLPSMLHGVKAGGIWNSALPPLHNPTEVAGLVTVNLALLVAIISTLLFYLAFKCVTRMRQPLAPGDWYELWLTIRSEGAQVHMQLGKTRYSGPVDLMLAMAQISHLHASRCIAETLRKGLRHAVKLDFPDVGLAPYKITLNAARGIYITIQAETTVSWSIYRQMSNLLYYSKPNSEYSLRCQLHLMNGKSTYVAVRVADTSTHTGTPTSGSERRAPASRPDDSPAQISSVGPTVRAVTLHEDVCCCE